MRTPEGELEFASLYDISNALRHGLVDGEDEVLMPGQTKWVRVADHSALKAHVARRRGSGRGASWVGSSSGRPSPRRWWR